MRIKWFLAPTVRSITALILREMSTTYGRSIGGYAWVIFEPVITISFLSLIFSLVLVSPPLGENFPLFYASGVLPFLLYRETASKVATAVQFSSSLLKYPSVTFLDALVARFALNLISTLTVFCVTVSGIIFFADLNIIFSPIKIFTALMIAYLLGAGFGALNSFLFAYSQDWQRLWNIITRPLFIISGILFIFESVPAPFQAVLWYNPIIHIVGLMRSGFYPTYDAKYVSISYVMILGLSTLVIGIFFLRRWTQNILDS